MNLKKTAQERDLGRKRENSMNCPIYTQNCKIRDDETRLSRNGHFKPALFQT